MVEHGLAAVCFPQLKRENGFLLVLSPPRLNYSPNRVHSTQININYADKKKKNMFARGEE